MAVYRSRGIVLRSIRYGEADRILDLYTTERGLVSAIVKGIRRTKSRFGARLEPLSCVEFLAFEGRSLDTLTQSETLRSFKGIREDLPRFETAARLVGYVRALSGGDEADRRVFNLLFHALDLLEKGDAESFGALEAAFGIKLSILAGYAPQFDRCAVCEADPEAYGPARPARFAPDLGGVVCAECATTSRDSFALPPGSPEALARLVRSPLREAGEVDSPDDVLRRVARTHVAANAPSGSAVGVSSRGAV